MDLATEMPSPYCPGRTISTCSSSPARVLEQEMLEQARAGKTRAEIESDLVDRFGADVMGTPLRTDIVMVATLGAICVAGWLVLRGRRWARVGAQGAVLAGAGATAGHAKISADESDRLEDALDDIDEF